MLLQYAHTNGWNIYDIYSDDNYSGSDRQRPEFQRLIADAKKQRFDIVLCKSQSRFTRELELVEAYIHDLFPRLGIRFVSIVDNADSLNPGNKKTRQINGLVNEWFLEDLSDSIRSSLTSQRMQGQHIGAFAPYGYQKDPNRKGHLLIDPEAAQVVQYIFQLYVSGHGKTAIAKKLNEQGVPNPTAYKRLHGMHRNKKKTSGNTLWSYFTISQILTNEVFIGNMVQGKSTVRAYKDPKKVSVPREQWFIVPGTHEPIIDWKLWDEAQRIGRGRSQSAAPAPEGIFARKVFCAHCGYSLHSAKNGTRRSFFCRTHVLCASRCPGTRISLPKLERIVLAQLQQLSVELLDMDALTAGIEAAPALLEKRTNIACELARYRQKLSENQTGLRGLYLDKINGIITEDEYLEFAAQLRTESSQFDTQITELMQKLSDIDLTLSNQNSIKLIAQQYVSARHLTKEMVDILIERIVVGKRDSQTKITPVEIHWTF